jgi:hypothetical protein
MYSGSCNWIDGTLIFKRARQVSGLSDHTSAVAVICVPLVIAANAVDAGYTSIAYTFATVLAAGFLAYVYLCLFGIGVRVTLTDEHLVCATPFLTRKFPRCEVLAVGLNVPRSVDGEDDVEYPRRYSLVCTRLGGVRHYLFFFANVDDCRIDVERSLKELNRQLRLPNGGQYAKDVPKRVNHAAHLSSTSLSSPQAPFGRRPKA